MQRRPLLWAVVLGAATGEACALLAVVAWWQSWLFGEGMRLAAGLLIGAPVLGTMLVAAARDRLAGKRSLRQAMRPLLAIILYVGAAIVTAQGLPLGEAPPN